MKRGQDISVKFPGLYLVHQNIPGKEVKFHAHDKEHILFIPLQGEIKLQLRDKEIVCGPGKMIYLPENTCHAFNSSSLLGERMIALISSSLWKKLKGRKHSERVLPTLQLCKELFFYLLLNSKTKHATAIVATVLHTLDESLEAQASGFSPDQLSSRIEDPRVRTAFDSVSNSFHESLSMEALAKKAGLSTRNLNRLFLTELGMTPKNLQALFRSHKAAELLQTGNFSVTDVALEVGYESLSQFIEVFRRTTGKLPSSLLPK